MLTLETVCKPHPGVVYQIVDGEAVVVLPQAGQIKVLNEVGTRIWSLLADHPNVQFNFYRPGIGVCEAEMH